MVRLLNSSELHSRHVVPKGNKARGVELLEYNSYTIPDPNDVAIAVMGATGSGKTTFINLVSGSNLRIGNGLRSCTSVVQTSVPFELDSRQVTLIDTPGFDDTTKSDADILKMIALFLSSTYEQGRKLAGVIYMHRISDFRMGGISKRNFKMFRELCGDSTLKNVAIVTNMWGEVSRDVGEAREAELASEDIFFKPALDKDARLLRHENTLASAQAILLQIIGNHPLALRIQKEIVDQHMDIADTAAGAELNRELIEQQKKHREELRKLQEEMQDAIRERDEETRKELEEESNRLKEEMRKVQSESQKLASSYSEDKAKFDKKVKELEESTKQQVERAEAARLQDIQRLEARLGQEANASAEEKAAMRRELENLRNQPPPRRRGLFGNIGAALDWFFGF